MLHKDNVEIRDDGSESGGWRGNSDEVVVDVSPGENTLLNVLTSELSSEPPRRSTRKRMAVNMNFPDRNVKPRRS